MWSVPSHDYLFLKETLRKTYLLSVHVISQTDPALVFVGPLTQRFLIFNTSAIHLLAGCDRTADRSARTTRRYL